MSATRDGALPPSTDGPESYLEGQTPNVLSDRVLGLHSAAPRPPATAAPHVDHGEGDSDDERDGLLDSATRHNTSRSRSRIRVARIVWYRRPSPIWVLLGTVCMSLAMGMIIPSKIEIYTQLVCRSIPSDRSGTTLPPPVLDFPGRKPLPTLPLPPRSSRRPGVGKFLIQRNEFDALDLDDEEGDTWAKQCRKSAVVQKGVARLATILTLVMGVLSALTTAYWGAVSDRWGRRPILALALLGTVFMDLVFLCTVLYHRTVGYEFLILGPLLDGLLGGMSTMTAATNAYITDCTDPGSRAKIFSVLGALLFAGIAIGPTVGSLLINATGSVLVPFYVALALHCVYLLVNLTLFPESLSLPRQVDARERHAAQRIEAADSAKAADSVAREAGPGHIVWERLQRAGWSSFAFLQPLALLLPRERADRTADEVPLIESKSLRRTGRSWELTKLGLGYAAYCLVLSIMQVKILYAAYKYGWGPQENGYYLTYIGSVRVAFLLVVLPLGIKLLRKSPPLPAAPRPVSTEFDSAAEPQSSKEQVVWEREAKYLRVVHDSHFDLFLARISIAVDLIGYTLLATNMEGSQGIFILASGISSFGSAASPAIQSLALALTTPRETGKVFASLSVISCVCSQIVGPVLFGVVWWLSIESYPEAMFLAGDVLFMLSLGLILTVRLGRRAGDKESGVQMGREERRGRSLTRKGSLPVVGE